MNNLCVNIISSISKNNLGVKPGVVTFTCCHGKQTALGYILKSSSKWRSDLDPDSTHIIQVDLALCISHELRTDPFSIILQ